MIIILVKINNNNNNSDNDFFFNNYNNNFISILIKSLYKDNGAKYQNPIYKVNFKKKKKKNI